MVTSLNRILIRLLGLLALIVTSYIVAQLLVSAWLPAEATRLVLGIPLLALLLPFAYWLLARRHRITGDIPYFLLPLDFLLPLSVFPTILLIIIFVTPRFAIWQWGTQGTGIVQALSIEEDLDPEFGRTRRYRVDFNFKLKIRAPLPIPRTSARRCLRPYNHKTRSVYIMLRGCPVWSLPATQSCLGGRRPH